MFQKICNYLDNKYGYKQSYRQFRGGVWYQSYGPALEWVRFPFALKEITAEMVQSIENYNKESAGDLNNG